MYSVVRVQQEIFAPGAELEAMQSAMGPGVGAITSFVGLVRDLYEDTQVEHLVLEHYPGMTERSIEKIVQQAAQRWPLLGVVIIHRVGDLAPGEPIVLVQVGSSHRAAAFAGCEYLMDYLKTQAVFWKRERTENAERWVQSTDLDRRRAAQWQQAEGDAEAQARPDKRPES